MSLTVTTREIYEAFYDDYGKHKAFLHSHTYAGNPLGCAAAHGMLDVLEQEQILPRARETARWLTGEMEARFGNHPLVGEIRHIGLIHALELVADKKTKVPFPAEKRLGYHFYQKALERGNGTPAFGRCTVFQPASHHYPGGTDPGHGYPGTGAGLRAGYLG